MAIGANLTKGQQLLILGSVLFAGLGGAYWYFPYRAAKQAQDELLAHVESLEKQNIHAKQDIARGTPTALREEADRYMKNLETMRQLVPTSNEVPLLLDQVSTAARRAGLEIGAVTPQAAIPGREFDTYRYLLTVVGNYHEIADFLANVGSLTRIVTPVNMKLIDVPDMKTGRRAKKNEALIQADMEVRTYVVRTAGKAAVSAERGTQ